MICFCDVMVRRLAEIIGVKILGKKNLTYLKRKIFDLKTYGYYMDLGTVESFKMAGMTGYGFSFLGDAYVVDKQKGQTEATVVRVFFSDPFSRQLLARRAVKRPLGMLKMRDELSQLLHLYLEPILLSRGIEKEHSVELLHLIELLHLPPAKWHQFKSKRKAIFSKALRTLNQLTTADGHRFLVEIQQGLNPKDFILVAKLQAKK
jgi:hypothetical protein